MTSTALLVAVFAVAVGLCGCAHDAARTLPEVPRLGVVDFPVSCGAAVQPQFNQAVALLHHMTYPQARAAFEAIAQQSPDCAMAQWGVAMTLFQPLWPTRPAPEALRRGSEALQAAQKMAATSAREQAFINATAAFFVAPNSKDYWQRTQRWETAMAALHDAYPTDPEACAFYALALLASARNEATAHEHSRQAIALLLPILQRNPDHPGAMHYIIHANDMPGREHENLDIVHRYEQLAPDNPHALHMPTHIYTRLGDWDGVIRGNLRAAAAALRYPAGEHGELVWDEFPHAIEYLVYGYLQQGDDANAGLQIARLFATQHLEPTAKTAFHLASTRARYALERHNWVEAAALQPRDPAWVAWDNFPWPEAIAWFAHGLGALHTNNVAEARTTDAHLQALQVHAIESGEEVFALQIQTLRLELGAWRAHTERDDATAITLMQRAVALEGSTPKPPVTPAATLPASELLGDLLIELGRPGEALTAYQKSLQRFPKRFNGTLGVARALAATGDAPGAARQYCALLNVAANSTRTAVTEEARGFVENYRAAHAREQDPPCVAGLALSVSSRPGQSRTRCLADLEVARLHDASACRVVAERSMNRL